MTCCLPSVTQPWAQSPKGTGYGSINHRPAVLAFSIIAGAILIGIIKPPQCFGACPRAGQSEGLPCCLGYAILSQSLWDAKVGWQRLHLFPQQLKGTVTYLLHVLIELPQLFLSETGLQQVLG